MCKLYLYRNLLLAKSDFEILSVEEDHSPNIFKCITLNKDCVLLHYNFKILDEEIPNISFNVIIKILNDFAYKIFPHKINAIHVEVKGI